MWRPGATAHGSQDSTGIHSPLFRILTSLVIESKTGVEKGHGVVRASEKTRNLCQVWVVGLTWQRADRALDTTTGRVMSVRECAGTPGEFEYRIRYETAKGG